MKISRTFRYMLVCSTIALSVAACDRGQKGNETEQPAASAEVDGPLKYESTTPYAKVSLTLPEAIKGYPDLYKQLYDAEVGKLKDYSEGAQSDRSEFGSADLPPYEKTILYSQPVETGRLFSMMRSDFDYSGGAHPNTVATGLLWDRTTNKQVAAADLFAADADKAALGRILCDAVNAAKKARQGSVPLQATGMWTCPDVSKVAVMLAPGDTAGKASGITFLLNAYDVGPYVEGAYYLTIPFEVLGKAINPAYAAEFAGTGPKGDVTQTLRPQ